MTLPTKVKIVDLTARDGIEGIKRLIPVDFRVELVNRLTGAGFPAIEVGEFVSPKVIPAVQYTEQVVQRITPKPGVEYSALVPNLRGFTDALAAGVKYITIFASATESFSHANINCSIEQSFARFHPVVAAAKQHDIKVRGAVSCVLGCPYEGDVDPRQAARIAVRLYRMGCYEIALGDSIGVGTPRSVQALIQECVHAGVPGSVLSAHFHNTCGMALANCYAALEMGVAIIESAAGGLGGCPNAPGATGNLAAEDLIYMLNGLGIESGVDLDKVVAIGQWATQSLDHRLDSKVNESMTNPHMTYFHKVGHARTL
ncbi:MAG TPA: hydroxymethylglutaryl-CoA lyase [Candidatus Binatia bacterium]|jgi:hydroxymethylglutaryl-CoA lyase|nr:hydroxymethylglutaryl-CoA lyase [Candidatus Binatia bacterium]